MAIIIMCKLMPVNKLHVHTCRLFAQLFTITHVQ